MAISWAGPPNSVGRDAGDGGGVDGGGVVDCGNGGDDGDPLPIS